MKEDFRIVGRNLYWCGYHVGQLGCGSVDKHSAEAVELFRARLIALFNGEYIPIPKYGDRGDH